MDRSHGPSTELCEPGAQVVEIVVESRWIDGVAKDIVEGIAAVREKRTPVFPGK
jgi:hypothetical protein